jgi:hypothetical protein
MRKKAAVVVMVVLVALVCVVPAMAANGPLDEPFFTLVGFVESAGISADGSGTIGVEVIHGNRFLKDLYLQTVQVQVTEVTEYRRWTPAGCVPTDPSNVDEGDTISIHGLVVGGVFVGDRVTIDVPLDCCTP